jgi:filamentous hemagglutinin family protein
MKSHREIGAGSIAAVVLGLCLGVRGQGPSIVLDGSTCGNVFGTQPVFIQGGELSGDHSSLFHNFSRFNVESGQSAVFLLPDAGGVKNVIARVTGSEQSVISGNIEAAGPGSAQARVFLLNPNGVLFNGNSSIDLSALVVSTANSIRFNGGATVTPGSTKTDLEAVTGNPDLFGDLGADGIVTFDNANLEMTNHGDVAIIAKDVRLNNSRITTDGAQVVIVGAGAGNSVGLDVSNRGQLPTLDRPAEGTVSLTDFSGVSTSHSSGGRIVIRGGVLTMIKNDSQKQALGVGGTGGTPGIGIDVEATKSLTLSKSFISTGTDDGTASDIRIQAPTVLINDEVEGAEQSAIQTKGSGGDIGIVTTQLTIQNGEISTNAQDSGNGGSIKVDTDRLTITEGGSIQSIARGSSKGGDIDVEVTGNMLIDGNGATRLGSEGTVVPVTVGIVANTLGSGPGGKVDVEVCGDLTLRNGGLIDSTTFATGDAGRISVEAENLLIDGENFSFPTGITAFTTDVESSFAGRGGNIEVDVPGDIRILNGGQIDTSSFGSGDAGRILIGENKTSGSIVIDKGMATRFTGIGSDGSGSGAAGEIVLKTRSLSIDNGGLISTGVFDGPGTSGGTGKGGNVSVFADSLKISGRSRIGDDGTSIVPHSAIFTGTQAGSSGAGGDVLIRPLSTVRGGIHATVQLSNGAEIGAGTQGTGKGGEVKILLEDGRVSLDSGSRISALSGGGGGVAGSVLVEARRISVVDGASISSRNDSDASGLRDAGSVTLRPGLLKLRDGRLEVSAMNGNGGDILIEGALLVDILGSDLVAEVSKESGAGGNVRIDDARYVLLDDTRVTASAMEGAGGNIFIKPVVLFAQSTTFDASSETGADGEVKVDSQVTLSGAEGELDASPLDVTDSLQPECTDALKTKAGSFIRTGRGGSARLPGGYLPSMRLHPTP